MRAHDIFYMNYSETTEFLEYYKRYYIVRDFPKLREVYLEEFPDIPIDLMKVALNRWLKKPKGTYEPTILEMKDSLWRLKLSCMCDLFDSESNEKWNAEFYGTEHFVTNNFIPEGDFWVKYDRLKPVLSEAEKEKRVSIIAALNRGLRGFNEQYEQAET